MNGRLGDVVLEARGVSRHFGSLCACNNVTLSVRAGEVLGIVGESGSGKSTLLQCLGGALRPDSGSVDLLTSERGRLDIWTADEVARTQVARTAIGLVHQNPRDGLMMDITAGGNIVEPLMAVGARHYGALRASAVDWMQRVELPLRDIDRCPETFSGGMQKRLQIARCLVTKPRLLLLDEPTGGLDVSVQARLLDLLRHLVRKLAVAVVCVTHDLAVARMLSERLLVMRGGAVVEAGLTDQILEDPQDRYTQTLVSAALRL
jgi:putative phosphonate transport system ATP-binding protein